MADIFGDPGDAAGLLRAALPPGLAQDLDLGSLRPVPGGLGDARLSWRYTDLLFEARLSDRSVLLVVVIEHQSDDDPLMPVRMLAYIVRKWEQWIDRHPKATAVPPVLGLVVCHPERGWRGPTRLREAVDIPVGVWRQWRPFVPELRLAVDDLMRQPDRELQRRPLSPLARLALLLLKHGRSKGLVRRMQRWRSLLAAVWREHGPAAAERIASYTLAVGDPSPEELGQLMQRTGGGERAKEAVMTTAERLEQAGERKFLLRQLRIRFGDLDDEVEHRVWTASAADLDRWAERVLRANTLDDVFDDD